MMKQKTLDIIDIIKGHTKYLDYYNNTDVIQAIKCYMKDEYDYEDRWLTDRFILNIMLSTMHDYLLYCDEPNLFIQELDNAKESGGNLSLQIATALSSVQVFDDDGNYINGFDSRLFSLEGGIK